MSIRAIDRAVAKRLDDHKKEEEKTGLGLHGFGERFAS
jgi:hypothetical protein